MLHLTLRPYFAGILLFVIVIPFSARPIRGASGEIILDVGSSVRSMTFSPDGKRILTGSYDRTARIWDISDLVTSVTDWELF